jgi:hypothetical protein
MGDIQEVILGVAPPFCKANQFKEEIALSGMLKNNQRIMRVVIAAPSVEKRQTVRNRMGGYNLTYQHALGIAKRLKKAKLCSDAHPAMNYDEVTILVSAIKFDRAVEVALM